MPFFAATVLRPRKPSPWTLSPRGPDLMNTIVKRIIAAVILIAMLGGAGYWYWMSRASGKTTFRFDTVKRGRLQATISSTGTLQPREVVDIGAQVAGPIIFIGK